MLEQVWRESQRKSMGRPSEVSGTSSLGCKALHALLYLRTVLECVTPCLSTSNLAENLTNSSSLVGQKPWATSGGHPYCKYVSGVHLCLLLWWNVPLAVLDKKENMIRDVTSFTGRHKRIENMDVTPCGRYACPRVVWVVAIMSTRFESRIDVVFTSGHDE